MPVRSGTLQPPQKVLDIKLVVALGIVVGDSEMERDVGGHDQGLDRAHKLGEKLGATIGAYAKC
jgi:hypothetical protein